MLNFKRLEEEVVVVVIAVVVVVVVVEALFTMSILGGFFVFIQD